MPSFQEDMVCAPWNAWIVQSSELRDHVANSNIEVAAKE